MSSYSKATFSHISHTMAQVYIFEVVEVVPDPSTGMKRWYQLKLRCRDDAKGPVTAICGMDNYLVSSMGQKVGGKLRFPCTHNPFRIRSLSVHSIWTSALWESRS